MKAFTLSFILAAALLSPTHAATASRCLFISSYHQGYAWSDGVERGLRAVLQKRCEIRQFDMDTKRHKDEPYKQRIGEQARRLIESWGPDVVITADDNAAKYVIQPYFKDSTIPFVFGGVNWTAKEYGFPYSNVTGMVEVAPIRPMLERAIQITPGATSFFYLGADTLTERKNLKRFQDAAAKLGLSLEHELVPTVDAWLSAYSRAQTEHEIVIMGSYSGIENWDAQRIQVAAKVVQLSKRLSVTNHEWMMPFTMIGMTKIPEEHGEWTGKAALAILDGMSPSEIPIVANRKWDLWINNDLLAAASIDLPSSLRRKAKSVQ